MIIFQMTSVLNGDEDFGMDVLVHAKRIMDHNSRMKHHAIMRMIWCQSANPCDSSQLKAKTKRLTNSFHSAEETGVGWPGKTQNLCIKEKCHFLIQKIRLLFSYNL